MSIKGERHRWRSRRSSRRLITLIFEGRNLMFIIRRELPLTRCAGLVPPELVSLSKETHCIKGTRVLRFVAPSIATSIACAINISLVDSVAASCSDSVVGFMSSVVFSFGLHANFPDEAEQFTTNGRNDLWFVLSRGLQRSISPMQSMLRLPGNLSGFGSGIRLSLQQPAAEPGPELVGPCSFNQHSTQVSITSFGDTALITMAATRVFTRHETAVTHQLFGAAEPGELANLSRERDGANLSDAAQRLQRADDLAHPFG